MEFDMATSKGTIDDDVRRAQDAPISEEEVERVRSLVGVWLRRDVHWPQISEPLSQHDIRRWSLYSVGDDNPLFTDADYGKRSMWGRTIAPPTFLYSVDSGIAAPGLPGVQWIHGGSHWHNYLPVRPGDRITARARMTDVVEKRGGRVPYFIIQKGETLYVDSNGAVVSRLVRDTLRVPRAGSGQGFKEKSAKDEPRTSYTKEEIEEIASAYRNEYRRGGETRYWEDVEVDEKLPAIVKGPLTLVDILAFYVGRRSAYNPLKVAFLERDRHPRNSYVDPETGIPVHPAAGHIDTHIAHRVGIPDAYDQGWMRVNWAAHLVTNWAGDNAFVEEVKVQLRNLNLVGDTTWCHGTVVDKSVRGDAHLVHIEYRSINQRGDKNGEGFATIRLPSRNTGDHFLVSPSRYGAEDGR